MNRGELIQKAVIVRDERKTFAVDTRREETHSSISAAKRYTRTYGCPQDKDGNPIRGFKSGICVTGKGVIAQIRKLLEIKDQRETEARARKAAEEKAIRDTVLKEDHKAGGHDGAYDEACPLCLETIAVGGTPK
jgi:hypothetical protein